MHSCQQITELVTEYLEGSMPWRERVKFKLHVMMCKHCRVYLKQVEATVAAVGHVPELELPSEVEQTLRRAFRERLRTGRDE